MKKLILLTTVALGFSLNGVSQFWNFSNPEKLRGTVNAEISEEGIPILSADLSTLYFVRTFDESNAGGKLDQDIWSGVRQEDGSYMKTEKVTVLNNKFNNAVIGMSSDGNTLFLLNTYEGKKDLEKGISYVKRKGDSWSTPQPIVIPGLDIENEFYQFHVSEKEDVIIICFMGENTLGNEDLYVSEKKGGVWSNPIHMGNTINSTGFEISPFLCPTQDTLFFSSNGFGGEGDADIFYSVRGKSWTDWSKPVNLGNRINSPKFDAYFAYHGKSAFWSSNRDSEKSDIFMIEILTPPALGLSCSAINISEFAAANGSIDALIEGGVAPYNYTWSNGRKSEKLTGLTKGEYTLTVVDAIGQTATTSCSIIEPAPPENKVIRMPEVRHPFNKWELLNDATISSNDSLLFVYNLLVEYPQMVLEVSSHTDARGSGPMNQKLSENRARACYKYLVEEKGVDPRRIIPSGKGENTPKTAWRKGDDIVVVKPADLTGYAEVTLTEKLINSYEKTNPELFEQLHQFNRRTECKVVSMKFDPASAKPADQKLLEYVKYP